MRQAARAQDLRETEAGGPVPALLDAALAAAPVVAYALSAGDGRVVAISGGVEDATGIAPDGFRGAAFTAAGPMHEDDRAAFDAAVDAARAEGAATAEYRLRRADGAEAWRRDTLRLRAAEGGAVILGTSVDITELRQAQDARRHAEMVKQAVLDASRDCIVAVDGDGAITEFNRAAELAFGCGVDDVRGRPAAEVLVPRDGQEPLREFLAGLDVGPGGRRVEIDARRCDGSTFPAELTVNGVARDGSSVVVGELRDVTENRRLLSLLHDAIESIPDGFAVFDADERLVVCNRAFAGAHGSTPDELVGVGLVAVEDAAFETAERIEGQPVTDRPAAVARLLRRLRRGNGRRTELRHADGRWQALTAHRTSDGGLVLIRTDVTAQKRAELSLRDSERHFRSLVEGHPLAVWMADLEDGRVLYESPAAAALVGSPAGDGTRLAIDHYADAADREALAEALRRRGEVRDVEMWMRRTDGTLFWASVTARLVVHRGRPVAVTSIIDLTERKTREAEMMRARETLEDAVESIAEGFALYDEADRLITCNTRYREFNALSADVLVPGVRWIDFLRIGAERGQYVRALGRVEDWLSERAAHPSGPNADYEIEQADGRWFQISRQRTRRGGIAVIRTDITRLKQMEKALRESEERFRGIAEAHPVPVVIATEEGEILYASPAAGELWHRPQSEIVGADIRDLYLDPAERERVIETFRRQGSLDFHEVVFQRPDGTPVPAALTARPIVYDGKRAIVTGVFDLTEQKAAEQQIAQQREALYQSEKLNALGTLLAGVAHELNNPLSVVVGQALLLQETVADPTVAKRAQKIGNAADRCARIVRTFLAMARQQAPEHKDVDLHGVIDSALDLTGYALRSAGIRIKTALAADLPRVWADPDQLNQVLMNLIVNAQQAMLDHPEPRRLKISTRYDAAVGMVRLVVADNGPGIPAEIRSRIFDPFFTTKGDLTGTGMGLAVSRGIVEAHGGRITVRSEPGRGTRFLLELPARSAAPAAEADAAEADAAEAKARPRRILVVDDEDEILQTLTDILGRSGHSVALAPSGSAALRLLEAEEFDLILSDMRMPGLDGPSLYARLLAEKPAMADRIAFITGDTLGFAVRSFLDETQRPCLEKPFTPAEIRDLVDRMTEPSAPA